MKSRFQLHVHEEIVVKAGNIVADTAFGRFRNLEGRSRRQGRRDRQGFERCERAGRYVHGMSPCFSSSVVFLGKLLGHLSFFLGRFTD
jgi:hypothetical protein